ncbi:MAG: hypothetical protein U9R57_05695 [Thermodesulfobacteriota bacterium]|nr:hypothetical protein [Thermodesulfobacteriota bacterium]
MNKIILYIAGSIFLLGLIFRILFALFCPDKFADGAQDVLFLEAREKALFPPVDKNRPPNHATDDQGENKK